MTDSVGIRTESFRKRGFHLHADPMFIHIEDEHMEADEVCLAGWVIGRDKGGDLLVGTVVSYRKGDTIIPCVSHDHSYIKSLSGRKVSGFYPIKKWHHADPRI